MSTRPLDAEWFWTDRWTRSRGFGLPMEARGVYREMLTQAWRRGAALPNDHETVRRYIGCTLKEWKRAWPLIEKFWVVDGDGLVNPTQVVIYLEAQAAAHRARSRGQAGAQALHKRRSGEACADLQACPPVSSLQTKEPPNPLSAKGGTKPPTKRELRKAAEIRSRQFGCRHDPRCADAQTCLAAMALELRTRAS